MAAILISGEAMHPLCQEGKLSKNETKGVFLWLMQT